MYRDIERRGSGVLVRNLNSGEGSSEMNVGTLVGHNVGFFRHGCRGAD
jgi:hypothetical protein